MISWIQASFQENRSSLGKAAVVANGSSRWCAIALLDLWKRPLHLGKLTSWKMKHLKMYFLFRMGMFYCYLGYCSRKKRHNQQKWSKPCSQNLPNLPMDVGFFHRPATVHAAMAKTEPPHPLKAPLTQQKHRWPVWKSYQKSADISLTGNTLSNRHSSLSFQISTKTCQRFFMSWLEN